jgi:rhodanese-related sulfurtransferase
MSDVTGSGVTAIEAAAPSDAEAHFASLLAFETDCSDVHEAMRSGQPDFVLLDVRSPDLFVRGHLPGAVNLPHQLIDEQCLSRFGDRLLVVYCAGPHCNGADKAALRIARAGHRVKKMVGGIVGWKDEGFELTI